MKEQSIFESRAAKARRILVIAGSMLLSFWLVVQLIAVGMFDFPKGESEGHFWMRIMAWALGGGLLAGLLWGRNSLAHLAWVLWPGAVMFVPIVVTLPFSLYEMYSNPSDEGFAMDLFRTGALLVLLAGITFFPVLGPLLFHKWRNRSGGVDVKVELGKVWRDVKQSFRRKW